MEPISGDLTKGGKKGDVPYGTLSTIHESALKFGLLYVGSDDGLIHVSKDGGNNWENISAGLPRDMWISRVQASSHKESRVYASLNGYRWDDFNAYLYVSDDYGKTWKQIDKDLPAEPINVVREDPKNANILYVGTDHGLYVSLNGGASFMAMNNNLPAVAVHDLVIHPRDNDLVVGTHGRSIYIGDVSHLQQLTGELMAKQVVVFEIPKVRYVSRWGSKRNSWSDAYEPKIKIPFYAKENGKAMISVMHGDIVLNELEVDVVSGLNYAEYDLSITKDVKNYEKALSKDDKEVKIKKADNGKHYLQIGKHNVKIEINGASDKQTLKITKR
jgi:ligand-binding sensor domain-containing protein